MNKSGYEGAFNFRDAGGYTGKDGRKVKKGLLYRSDELSKLTAEDVKKMNTLGIQTIIDYRSEDERVNNEDNPGLNGELVYLTPVANIAAFASKENDEMDIHDLKLTGEVVSNLMIKQNEAFVEMDQCRVVFKELLDIAADTNKIPSVQHCRGGKDRTGYGIALILGLIGVSDEDIMKDYLLTNTYKYEKNEKSLAELEKQNNDKGFILGMRYFKEARPEFLQTALDIINQKYGGITAYAQSELGVTDEQIQQLQDIYLEKK